MRKFGESTPEVMEFAVGGSEKTYKMPLAASMPFETSLRFAEVAAMPDGEAKNLASARLQMEMLRDAMGDDAARVTPAQVAEIFEAWGEESAKQGATTGE